MSFIIGLLLVIISALSVGTSAWPLKACKQYSMEHVLFFCMVFGLLFLPWLTMFCICDVREVFASLDTRDIILSNIFSLAWGIANVLCYICYVKIGFVITGVLLNGASLIVATLVPFVIKGGGVFSQSPDLFSKDGIISIVAVVIIFLAILILTKASNLRDTFLGKKQETSSLTKLQKIFYYLVAFVGGLLSTGIVLINTYCGHSFNSAMEKAGVTSPLKGVCLWAVGMLLGIFVNIIYSLCLMYKNHSFGKLLCFKEFVWACCDGVQFYLYLMLFGFGTLLIGPLGASIGNGVADSMIFSGKLFVGLAFGEWKGVSGKPVKVFIIGLIILFLGIILLSFK